jgi:putative phosphoribosyl transferase
LHLSGDCHAGGLTGGVVELARRWAGGTPGEESRSAREEPVVSPTVATRAPPRGAPRRLDLNNPVVLGLPRGGVTVGYEVARRTGAPLEVFVVRKIGIRGSRSIGVGAIAEGGEPVLDMPLLARLGLDVSALDATIAAERRELARRVRAYRGDRSCRSWASYGGRRRRRPGHRRQRTLPPCERSGRYGRALPTRLVLAVPVGAADTARRWPRRRTTSWCCVMPEPMRVDRRVVHRLRPVSDAEGSGSWRQRGSRRARLAPGGGHGRSTARDQAPRTHPAARLVARPRLCDA